MIQFGSNRILLKVKGYVKENWGSPFILGFIVLLVVSIGFCALFGFPNSASVYSIPDTLAICAYCSLAAGVCLQLVRFLKYRDKNDYDGEVS